MVSRLTGRLETSTKSGEAEGPGVRESLAAAERLYAGASSALRLVEVI